MITTLSGVNGSSIEAVVRIDASGDARSGSSRGQEVHRRARNPLWEIGNTLSHQIRSLVTRNGPDSAVAPSWEIRSFLKVPSGEGSLKAEAVPPAGPFLQPKQSRPRLAIITFNSLSTCGCCRDYFIIVFIIKFILLSKNS